MGVGPKYTINSLIKSLNVVFVCTGSNVLIYYFVRFEPYVAGRDQLWVTVERECPCDKLGTRYRDYSIPKTGWGGEAFGAPPFRFLTLAL